MTTIQTLLSDLVTEVGCGISIHIDTLRYGNSSVTLRHEEGYEIRYVADSIDAARQQAYNDLVGFRVTPENVQEFFGNSV